MKDSLSNYGRYVRQQRFAPFGPEGQDRLRDACVLVCGCGALGCVVSDFLVRAGVGMVRIVDRDFVERDNLHRQILFSEEDARAGLPKAEAAARRLREVNSEVVVDPHVADLNAGNIRRLGQGIQVVVDGTDNFETRFLMNDYAVEQGLAWVFAGCVGAEGQSMAIVPGETPCLACFMPEPPPSSSMPTCETAGVLGPIVGVIASFQAMEVLKLCSGNAASLNKNLAVFDLWGNQIRTVNMASARRPDCSTCGQRSFPWLSGQRGSTALRLCGRNSIQISPPEDQIIDLPQLAERLRSLGPVMENPYLLRAQIEGFQITVFADGRAIVGGTDSEVLARSVLAKYVGM